MAPKKRELTRSVIICRRGYGWSLTLAEWSAEERVWLEAAGVDPRRMVSGQVAQFLHHFGDRYDAEAVEILPFDRPSQLRTTLPFHEALDWFIGLSDEPGLTNAD